MTCQGTCPFLSLAHDLSGLLRPSELEVGMRWTELLQGLRIMKFEMILEGSVIYGRPPIASGFGD